MPNSDYELAIQAIRDKLVGKTLTAKEIYAVMDEVAQNRLGPILTAYFVAAGFSHGFSNEELFYLVKAMAETGEKLKFKGIVADKHSTGGVAGTRTTMIIAPIVAAAGFQIPKTSSRAITSPAGTADVMEVFAPVTFSVREIEKIVGKTGGCIVWGGSINLAPADDILIQVERPLNFESFDKIIVSIMAKKLAVGATHLVIDIPVGPTMKIQHFQDAEMVAKKFLLLAEKFKMKMTIDVNHTFEPAGNGAGPVLEARDVLRILERKKNRPHLLEKKALRLAGKLLDLCLANSKRKAEGLTLASEILEKGLALKKLQEIIKVQGGNPEVESDDLELGLEKWEFASSRKGRVTVIDSHEITAVCRILGSPEDKKAGIYFERKLEDKVDKGDILYIIYSSDRYRLDEARETLKSMPVYKIE